MKDLLLAYSPYGNGNSIFPFNEVFTYAQNAQSVGFANADAFVLWGGTDIHPSYYGQSPHPLNGAPSNPSERDVWEWKAMLHCKANNIPIIGVCRGAQFLCAFAGGKVVQHMMGHNSGNHAIVDIKGSVYPATSSHHQMLDLYGSKYELLAWTPANLSKVYMGETAKTPDHIRLQMEKGVFKEPEIVYFPDVNGLAIQGHPEWSNATDTFVKECNKYVVDLLLTKTVWR